VKPKRSILFIALTGEEKGLLGSDFFAQNPSVPQAAIAACVNLDMPILLYDFSAVTAFGAERSNLNDALARAAAELKLTVVPDPFPEQGIFTRSDHYSFVRQGVPSIYVTPGFASAKKEENAAQIAGNFLTTHYHKVSDDMNLPLNFEAAARYAQLNYYLGVEIANSAQPIAWVKGDFFGELFKK
jgi:Zn-dependent M28 family amino/carboxypeptidase